MTTRSPYFFSTRAVATSDRLNDGARGWLAYAQNSSDQTGINAVGSYDITGCSVTPFIHTNRLIKISAQATFTITSAATKFSLDIVEGGTTLARAGEFTADAATNGFITAGGVIQLSGFAYEVAPSIGNHTYKLQATVISGSGGFGLAISGTNPANATILVEDIGDAG